MNLAHSNVHQAHKLLGQLERWLDLAVEYAVAKKFDVSVLLQSRLAADQFPLLKQVQSACDQAKFAAARTAGKEAPKHPDTETTLEELKARIGSVRSYLEGFSDGDFEGLDTRVVSQLAAAPGKAIKAADYQVQLAMPNFYFHLTTAYAILRHNGVPLGKRDFLGAIDVFDA
jgi:uncharacterized protein